MKASAGAAGAPQRHAHTRARVLLAGVCWLVGALLPQWAHAQVLTVVELSEQDAAAARKLTEMLGYELNEVRASDPERALELACAQGATRGVIFDAAHGDVQLLRCADRTSLRREVAQDAADTAYLAAFVAAELLALDAQLTLAADGGKPAAAAAPAPPPASAPTPRPDETHASMHVQLGGDWLASGEVFAGSLRPNLGVAIAPPAWRTGEVGAQSEFSWWIQLFLAPLAKGSRAARDGRIDIERHDLALRVGLRYELARIGLVGFILARGSSSAARYSQAAGAPNNQLRAGVGAGVQADLALSAWALLYVSLTLDAAISRSDYQIRQASQVSDPTQLLSIGAGFALRAPL